MRTLFSLTCVIVMLAAAACHGSRPGVTVLPGTATTSLSSASPAALPSSEPSPSPESEAALPTRPAVSASASPTPSASSTPAVFSPAEISASNAPSLQPVWQQTFGPWDHVLKLAWSPDGRALAVSAGEVLHILDSGDLGEKLKIEMNAWAPDLAYAPDGHSLAVVDRDGLLRVWDAASGELALTVQAHQKSASGVAYSPLGGLLATAGYDAMARLWELPNGEKLAEMIGGTFAVPAIAFTPDGASLAIVNGSIIRLRDVGTGRFVKTIAAGSPLFTIAFSPDGSSLASGDVANTVQLWDMANDTSPSVEIRQSIYTLAAQDRPVSGYNALVWQVTFSPDGSLLAAACGDGSIRIWDVASGSLAVTLSGHSRAATSAAFSPDGRWLASGGLDGRLILWGVGP